MTLGPSQPSIPSCIL